MASTARAKSSGPIGAGQIVGAYYDASLMQHGFLYANGTYTTLDNPSANFGTVAQAINGFGQVVGYYRNITGIHGFVYNPNDGTYTRIDDPLGRGTFPSGINDAGQIVGYYVDASGQEHGYLYSAGVYTTLEDPLATHGNRATGINGAGQIVGFYDDNTGRHGFLYQQAFSWAHRGQIESSPHSPKRTRQPSGCREALPIVLRPLPLMHATCPP
jgi:probable HAF family extracellular repeat protein